MNKHRSNMTPKSDPAPSPAKKADKAPEPPPEAEDKE